MILVDTSVWIDHLARGEVRLAQALDQARVMMHPFVIGELACGNLADRRPVLRLLGSLPTAPRATDDEVLHFIEQHRLMGRGIGYIDAHLLAATALAADARLWTRDTQLARAAAALGLGWQTPH